MKGPLLHTRLKAPYNFPKAFQNEHRAQPEAKLHLRCFVSTPNKPGAFLKNLTPSKITQLSNTLKFRCRACDVFAIGMPLGD